VLENGEERNESPFDSVFITEPVTQFNVSVGEKMRNTDWRQKHVSKNLENSWKNGRHFVYCEGRQEIALEVCANVSCIKCCIMKLSRDAE